MKKAKKSELDPYCGFKSDAARERALKTREKHLTVRSVTSLVVAAVLVGVVALWAGGRVGASAVGLFGMVARYFNRT